MVQEEREVVVVFPLAYHQGFNHGFNMAEAVNFGSRRWVEYGKRARGCLCLDSAVAVKIEMTPLVEMYQPELLNSWKQHDILELHPEDPDYLHEFLKDARKRLSEGKLTEGEWEEVRVSLRDMGTIPEWYEIRFGVGFYDQNAEIVSIDARHHEDEISNDGKPMGEPLAASENDAKVLKEVLVGLKKKYAVLKVQRWWRGTKKEEAVKQEKAALILQATWKGFRARQLFLDTKNFISRLQAVARVFLERQRLEKMRLSEMPEQNLSEDLQVIEEDLQESVYEVDKERGSTLSSKRGCGKRIEQGAKRRRFEVKVMVSKIGNHGNSDSRKLHVADEIEKEEDSESFKQHFCICPACKMKFGREVGKQLHLASIHQGSCQEEEKQTLKGDELECQAKDVMSSVGRKFFCQVPGCGGSFEDSVGTLQHFETTHQLKNKKIHKLGLTRTQVLKIKKWAKSKKPSRISQQSKDFGESRKMRCGAAGCNKVFNKKGFLEAHMRLRHNKSNMASRRCPAPWCAESFKVLRDQMAHFEEYHMVDISVSVMSAKANVLA